MEKFYLFTYGTLMRRFANPFAEKLRAASIYEGTGFFSGRLYRVAWYPGAVYDDQEIWKVYGEFYQLNNIEILKELDEYEDVLEDESASLYLRKIVPVILEDGSKINCWTYLYNQSVDGFPVLETGHFTS